MFSKQKNNNKKNLFSDRIDPSKMLIWHVNPYGESDPNKDISANNDPYAVLRKSSPWPPRNAKCFQSLNALIERFLFILFNHLIKKMLI